MSLPSEPSDTCNRIVEGFQYTMLFRILMDSLFVSVIPKDSLSVMDASQVAAFYADLLDQQQAQFNIFHVAIGIIFATALGLTWWWNYRGAKQKIIEEMENNREAMLRLFRVSTGKMEGGFSESIKKEMDTFSNSLHKEFDEYKELVSKDIKHQQAELSRVFALHCQSTDSPFASAAWWFKAAYLYNECDVKHFCQVSVNAGVDALKETVRKNAPLDDDSMERLETISQHVDSLPDYFASQKKETKDLVRIIRKQSKGSNQSIS